MMHPGDDNVCGHDHRGCEHAHEKQLLGALEREKQARERFVGVELLTLEPKTFV
jgi:hypothetical protein